MQQLSLSFGTIIAYIVPGFIATFVLGTWSADIRGLTAAIVTGSVPALVAVLLISTAAGMVITALVWLVIRPFLELIGARRPPLNYGRLRPDRVPVYTEILEANYRFYLAYSNLAVALGLAALAMTQRGETAVAIVLGAVALLLLLPSRDALKRSYDGMLALMESDPESGIIAVVTQTEGDNSMANGNPAPNPGPRKPARVTDSSAKPNVPQTAKKVAAKETAKPKRRPSGR